MPKKIQIEIARSTITRTNYLFNIPISCIDHSKGALFPLPGQKGGTCGLCAAHYALQRLGITDYDIEGLAWPDEALLSRAIEDRQTALGEMLDPDRFATWLQGISKGQFTAHSVAFNQPEINATIMADGYVLVPFNVSPTGQPLTETSAGQHTRAHWCLIAGYNDGDLLALHWGKPRVMDAQQLKASNQSLYPFQQSDLITILHDWSEDPYDQFIMRNLDRLDRDKLVVHKLPHPIDGHSASILAMKEEAFSEVQKLRGKMITLLPPKQPDSGCQVQ